MVNASNIFIQMFLQRDCVYCNTFHRLQFKKIYTDAHKNQTIVTKSRQFLSLHFLLSLFSNAWSSLYFIIGLETKKIA